MFVCVCARVCACACAHACGRAVKCVSCYPEKAATPKKHKGSNPFLGTLLPPSLSFPCLACTCAPMQGDRKKSGPFGVTWLRIVLVSTQYFLLWLVLTSKWPPFLTGLHHTCPPNKKLNGCTGIGNCSSHCATKALSAADLLIARGRKKCGGQGCRSPTKLAFCKEITWLDKASLKI
jgi:hypothetical protein